MSLVPETSTTLLREVGSDADHARWGVFCARYEPMMRAYLVAHFPGVEAEDVLQETFIALVRALPRYRYCPDERGHFHNYLTGILRRKAADALAARTRREALAETLSDEAEQSRDRVGADDAEAARRDIYEVALQQLLADETVQARTKQIFLRTTSGGEAPAAVAESLGVTVATVYLVRNRCIEKLKRLVAALESV